MRSTTLIALALLVLATGCGSRPAPPAVRAVSPPSTTSAPTTTELATPDEDLAADTPATPADPELNGPAPGDLRRQVDTALLRYDLALTALAAHPDRAGDSASAERTAWAGVVVSGSPLDDAMVEEVVRRGTEEDGAVLPPPGGLSYRHTSLTADSSSDGSIEFTWCGHSPGIGVERSTGTVVDDAVGHSHGTGRLQTDGATVRIAELEQTRLDVLPAGTPDPCPSEVRP